MHRPAALAAWPLALPLLLLLAGCGGGSGTSAPQAPPAQPVEEEEPGSGGEGTDEAPEDSTGGDYTGGDSTGGDSGGTPDDVADAPQPDAPDGEAPLSYRVREIPEEHSFPTGSAVDIDNSGRVLFHFAVWREAQGYRQLQEPENFSITFAQTMNDNGWAIGIDQIGGCSDFERQALVWRADGSLSLRGLGEQYAPFNYSSPTDINDRDTVVGLWGATDECGLPPNPVADFHHFFRWDAAGVVDLGTLGVEGIPETIRLNNPGALAFSVTGSGGRRAFYRDPSGLQQEIPAMQINGLSEAGEVFGCTLTNGRATPAIWSTAGLRSVDTGGEDACIADLNSDGDALISPRWADGGLLYRDGELHDIAELLPEGSAGGSLGVAALNDAGQILIRVDGRPLILEPVP